MAIDNRLQVFNEEGQSVDYDILASDVKFLPDGKDLPTKLAEMEAHQGDGTVKGVKMNNGSPIEPDGDGVVDLGTVITQHQDISGKVDKVDGKGLSTNDYTTAEKTKLQNLPTADQLTQQLGSKANDNAVVKSISVNGTSQTKDTNGNVNIQVQAGDQVSVIQPDPADGTFIIRVGSTDYTINLNHTHENMAKLVVCEESDLPSTLDNSTIYAITDSGETEIEKLIIRGMEFAGGGTPSTEPKIVSPIGTQIDFNGESTKTVTVRASNLIEALTIAVTGVTANLQTISASDAEAGVQLTLTQGQDFDGGTLRIYSSEVDKSWSVEDSQTLTAVKFTGTQWIDTGYTPGPDTSFELDCKFEPNTGTNSSTSSNSNCAFLHAPKATESFMFQTGYSNAALYSLMVVTDGNNTLTQHEYGESVMKNVRGIISYTNGSCTYLGYTFNPLSKSALSNGSLKLAYNSGKTSHPIFDVFNLYVYGFKIYNSGTLVRDFEPRLRNNVAGLYDVVNGVFYTSETSSELEAVNS